MTEHEHSTVPAPIIPIPKWLTWVVALAVTVSLTVALMCAAGLVVVLVRLSEADARAARTVCIAEMQGDVFAAIGDSFDAPPAPSPARSAAVKDIAASASRFKDIPKFCPTGAEHPLPPATTRK